MNRKMVALVLAGMIVATVATVLAWDKTDLDTETGAYGIAIAVVRANFSNGDIVASDHDHDGGWKPGVTPPEGWSATNVGNCGTIPDKDYPPWDSVWADSYTYILDQYNRIKEYVSASASLP